MHRQIVLDTETTGIRIEDGHRIIEVGCVEMIDRKLTGKHFHQYINPDREIEAGALAVHGISNDFLRDKPNFGTVAPELLDFISGSELIIHNAPFDLSFLNNEFLLASQSYKPVTDHCHIIDTLQIARQLHVGQRNSLDALCKRYGVDNSKRDFHGALLDAHLLAQVYLAMTGGQGSFFDSLHENQSINNKNTDIVTTKPVETHKLVVVRANEQEIMEHENYLRTMKELNKCLWLDD